MTRQYPDKLLYFDQLLYWALLTGLTSAYFFLYDVYYLSRDISFLNTVKTTSQAWAIWLLLIPVIVNQVNQVNQERLIKRINISQLLLLAIFCIAISLFVQWLIFIDQPGIKSTLFFCYLPANIKIFTLLIVLAWLKSKPKNQLDTQSDKQQTLLCQNLKAETITLSLHLITHIQADGNYLNIHTPSNSYIKRATINQTTQQLKACGFIRTHRSHLVNIKQIKQLKTDHVILLGNRKVPIGRTYQTELRELYEHQLGQKSISSI